MPDEDRTSVRARTTTAAVLLLAALAAGCTDAGGRYAATIDGEPAVETAEVARIMRGLEGNGSLAGVPEGQRLAAQQDNQRQVLSLLIQQELAVRALATQGIEVSEAQVRDAVAAQVEEAGGEQAYRQALVEQGVTPDLDEARIRGQLLGEAFEGELDDEGRAEVLESLGEPTVEVDPRLGTFDPAQGSVVAGPAT